MTFGLIKPQFTTTLDDTSIHQLAIFPPIAYVFGTQLATSFQRVTTTYEHLHDILVLVVYAQKSPINAYTDVSSGVV